jgi:hypothetical protein
MRKHILFKLDRVTLTQLKFVYEPGMPDTVD